MIAIFTTPMVLHFDSLLWLLLPLCASVAVTYKTIRTRDLRRLPIQIGSLLAYMAGGLIALGVALWMLHEYWPFSP